MARKTFHKAILFLLVPAVWMGWSGCKRTLSNDEIVGKDIISAPDGFTGIVGAIAPKYVVCNDPWGIPTGSPANLTSTSTLQMRWHKVYFANKLSHPVTWTIKYVGTYSGAEKTFTETSDTLSAGFRGTADGTRFFIPGDTVNYTISFLGSSITYTGSFKLNTTSNGGHLYTDLLDQRVLLNGDTLHYKLVDDMGDGVSTTPIRTSYSDAADAEGAAKFFVTTSKQVDGHFSFYMIGTDKNSNTYCGGASGESLTEMYYATSQTDPSKVYINAYIYGYGRPNTAISFQVFEDDSWNLLPPIPTVRPPAATNDMWYSLVQIDWVGWKLVSIPYSSFKPANNPASGGGGNRIREPHKMAGFGIELDSYPNGGSTVELALDAVYITTNGPFVP